MRADTNFSVRPKGRAQLGTKVELKNINSFKFIGDAIEYRSPARSSLLSVEKRLSRRRVSGTLKSAKAF